MLKRTLKPLISNSFFLFGARGVGKTSLIYEILKNRPTLYIDLLDPTEFESLTLNSGELGARLKNAESDYEWIVLDEIQKAPALLDVVHQFIERKKLKFALTGSSARKLKRGGANLLAGRAYTSHLFPLTFEELGESFNLDQILSWGSLPKIFSIETNEEKKIFLQSYAQTYVKEEIQSEQIVRRLDPFRRFLAVAAQSNGQIINYAHIARDVGASDVTVQSYFTILEDTLLGLLLEPFHRSIRKRQRENPKFYFFDTGVQRALSKTLDVKLKPQTYAYGAAFEHFIVCEIARLCSYRRNDFTFSYLRTKDDAEIDLIIERPGMPTALVEIKSSASIDSHDISALRRFLPDFPKANAYCLSTDPNPKRIDKIECLPWADGIREILGTT